MKSNRASSAQWMSSNTSTVGPSSASASKNRRHAANASDLAMLSAARRVRALQADQGPQVTHHPLAIPLVQDQRRDRLRELRVSYLRCVGLQDASLGLDHLAQRPEGDALPVGE